MSGQNKVVKFKKRRGINIGIIVFLILFLYIAINVYIYLTKDKLSIYEVHEGSTAIDNHITGLVLRSEKVIHSQKAGYITYYQKEGARVARNTAIYSVDENGQLYNVVDNGDLSFTLTEKNNSEIKHDIRTFQDSFSDNNFSSIYTFKENAQSTVLDILNSSIISQGQALAENTGLDLAYEMVPSEESGIVSYYVDSFENVTADTVTEDMFQQKDYKRASLRQTEMSAINSPIYKLITSETWSIILPLTQPQYDKLNGKDRVTFTVLDDDFEMPAALSLTQKGSAYYAQLTMNKYLENYLEDRYLDVELDFDTVEGLKIPTSAIVEKDFYVVPLNYFAQGGNSTKEGLTVISYSNNGDISHTFVPTDIYYQDTSVAYVDTELFDSNTKILSPVNSDEYTLAQTSKLTGVYNVNLGYAVFKRIEILNQGDDYCIIDKNTSDGLAAYDHIALDGSTAIDQAIIY